ncbi:MAG: metallopeptidase [Desulfurococcales archaeon]|nr:metallopeptidase [Desulfurococcales archaeon]
MGKVRYELAPDICGAVKAIIESGVLQHLAEVSVHCVRSRGSRSSAIARIYGLPRPWIVVLGYNPGYVIEVLSEKFDLLSTDEKIRVLIHELLHIPKTLSGALRPHGKYVNSREVWKVFRKLKNTPYYERAVNALS